VEEVGKLILRLTTAGLILFHGIAKLIHGVSRIGDMLAASHIPSFVSYAVYLGEVVAPIFIIIPRIASFSCRSEHDCGDCPGRLPQHI